VPSKYMLTGALDQGTTMKTAYEDAEIHLYQTGMGIVITPSLDLTALEAAEADYTGYAALVVAAWLGPMLGEGSGALIWSGSQLFESDSPFSVQNVVAGWWIQTAGGTLVMAGSFDAPISMGNLGQSIPFEIYIPFGVNPT